MPFVPVTELKNYVGKELGYSEWLTIDQERINLLPKLQVISSSFTWTRSKPPRHHSAGPSPTDFCRCRSSPS